MKTLLAILLISVSLAGCISGNDNAENEQSFEDSATTSDSVVNDNNAAAAPEDPANETIREIMATLLSSKQEINTLESEISDSLTRSGLSPEQRSLFSKTIQQLESSSKLINKQIEQIVISDLQSSKEKLNEIVSKMKASEKGLGGMVARLDKITNYMQIASNLIQTLVPISRITGHSER